jgi:hypothetical protein
MLAGLQLILAAGAKAIFPAAIGGPLSETLQVGAAIVQLLGRAVFG